MLHPSKQVIKSVLYVTPKVFGFEEMIQHCLWKVLSETGLNLLDELTEMERKILADILVRGRNLSGDLPSGLVALNRAVDKIVCHVKNLQFQSQKYHSVIKENRQLKIVSGESSKFTQEKAGSGLPVKINRAIDEIGLSKRTARLLKSWGVDTLEQLRAWPLSRIRNQARVGVKTIHEIETILSSYSIHLSAE